MATGADLELCHHHTTWSLWASYHWGRRSKTSPTLLGDNCLNPDVPQALFCCSHHHGRWVLSHLTTSLLPSKQKLLELPPQPHHHLRQSCAVKLIQMIMGSLTHMHRERDITWQSVMLTSLEIPPDSSRGCSRPQWSSKCLNMKLLAYSVSSQRSQSLVCQSIVSGKRTSPG